MYLSWPIFGQVPKLADFFLEKKLVGQVPKLAEKLATLGTSTVHDEVSITSRTVCVASETR